MLKKMWKLLLLAAVLASCTAGCGRGTEPREEGGELVRAGEFSPAFVLWAVLDLFFRGKDSP